ncbi:MAG: type II toxin-antitoxin system RelE/ParE family toxin [Hyphomicrobiaceae bacterium]|jgi:plasmid stabilization system protein ParE
MRVVYAPQALRDVDDILAYIHKRSPSGAHNVSIAIEREVEACASNPRGGVKTDEAGVYRRPLRKYRYTVFYRFFPDADEVEIARVVRGARVKNLGRLPRDD